MAAGDVSGAYTQLRGLACNLFDGVDDYVEIQHNSELLGNNLTNGFTISAWINPFSGGETGGGMILNKTDDTTALNGFHLRMGGTFGSTSRPMFNINNGAEKGGASGSIISRGWYHTLVTISAAQRVTFYLNGVLSGTANQDVVQPLSTIISTSVMRIGNPSNSTDRSWFGGICNVKLWNKVLSSNEITEAYAGGDPARNNLFYYFKLGGDYTNYGSLGGTATNSGSIPTILDDQFRDRLKAQYVGAKDKFMIADVGNGEILSVSIEGG